jgi:hypothetical protein
MGGITRRLFAAILLAGGLFGAHVVVTAPKSEAHLCARVEVSIAIVSTAVSTDGNCTTRHDPDDDDWCPDHWQPELYVIVCVPPSLP